MSLIKIQSAMEYLMTYGWAILVVAVVLGALYQLGIFGTGTSALAPACLASSGFLCQTPTLNTSGYLAVKFGQIGTSSITVTNIACTSNVTAPSTTNSVSLTLTSGATAIIAFQCPLSSNSIGSGFKGYLWLTYNTPIQSGVVDRIAIVTGKVSTSGNVIAILGGGLSAGGPPSTFGATCGGTLTVSAGNDICTFTSSGNFIVTGLSGSVAALVVGGGGGGGDDDYAGGGGGGGFSYTGSIALSPATYGVTVGAGGSGGASGYNGLAGSNSIFYTITAVGGGGGGGGFGSTSGLAGGSGGGGDRASGGGSTAGQGNNGGSGTGGGGGGGGGAGAVGSPGATNVGGNGGSGSASSISGSSTDYGGGGGGGGDGTGGSGGLGGGGKGATGSVNGVSGTANTGGGGGGGSISFGTAGAGGSGIVIISYNAAGNGTP